MEDWYENALITLEAMYKVMHDFENRVTSFHIVFQFPWKNLKQFEKH